jgi:DHA2 family multidrug resistance protein
MALSQTLLLRIFPERKIHAGDGTMGDDNIARARYRPVLGGWICDHYSWSWVFIINVPMAIAFSVVAWSVLKIFEDKLVNNAIDIVGFVLLVIWVGALQIMLDEGKILTGLPQKKYGFWRLLPVSAF